ncbi:MAG: ABC transporter ATP-binding protein [Victivallales bacterium]|nr:ABC transporter ATP-binding protein [Victivallales bacterium]
MEAEKKEDSSSLGKILVFMRPYRMRLYMLLFLTGMLSLLVMVPPIVTMMFVDRVLTRGEGDKMLALGFFMVAVPTLAAFFRYFQAMSIAYLGQHFIFDIRYAMYNHFLRLSLRFFGKYSVGKLSYRLMEDSGVVNNMFTSQTVGILSDLVCSSFALVATFMLNWRLATMLLLLCVIFVLNYRLARGKILKYSKLTRRYYDYMSTGVQNRLTTDMAVKTFGTQVREQAMFNSDLDSVMRYEKEAMLANNNFWMNVILIDNVGKAILFFIGCAMVLKGDMTYGGVTAFSAYTVQLMGPAVRFSNIVNQLQQVSISTNRIFEIFDEQPEIVNCENPIVNKNIKGKVDFNHVQFQYVEGKPVLRDISIHCKPGDTTALIGPTGCGKSTVLNLLLRFYDVTGGELLIDDVDIRKLDLHTLRNQFGIVLQESLLFGISIRENIRYGRASATDQDVEEAAKVAEIHDFIMTLPDGYDTPVGDFGIELSVGQKQRINIARAVCANPAILIMDEATSSLDSDSEQAIQKAMDKVLAGRTSFVVAHRLSTIKNADRIIMLDGGYICEQGTHDELMAMENGRYRELYLKHKGVGVIED